jgi:hypothetical protein
VDDLTPGSVLLRHHASNDARDDANDETAGLASVIGTIRERGDEFVRLDAASCARSKVRLVMRRAPTAPVGKAPTAPVGKAPTAPVDMAASATRGGHRTLET